MEIGKLIYQGIHLQLTKYKVLDLHITTSSFDFKAHIL